MKTKKTKKQDTIKFSIKKKTSIPVSSQEHRLSEDVKAFRGAASKMERGDSIECTLEQRHKIQNFLRFRNLNENFKSRTISKKDGMCAVYCIKSVNNSQLV